MKLHCVTWTVLLSAAFVPASFAAELPGDYFKLHLGPVKELEGRSDLQSDLGAMLAATVLYTKKHPANASFGDRKKLELALKLGDLAAQASAQDKNENKQDYEWEI